jgi:hypothetical protein
LLNPPSLLYTKPSIAVAEAFEREIHNHLKDKARVFAALHRQLFARPLSCLTVSLQFEAWRGTRLTKWNHNFGRQLRLLLQHLELKQHSDLVSDAEDTEHIRQVVVYARCGHSRPLTRLHSQALVSYRMNGFCINQPFTGMQPLVNSIFNSDIHNNGDLNEELWYAAPQTFFVYLSSRVPLFAVTLRWRFMSSLSVAKLCLFGSMLPHWSNVTLSLPVVVYSAAALRCSHLLNVLT